jgi:putative endonuclease
MYHVYLLQSEVKTKEFYLGLTGNLKKRIIQHNNKETKSTARYVPWRIVYYEAFQSREDAQERERKLKHHGKGMSELKKRLKNSIQNH